MPCSRKASCTPPSPRARTARSRSSSRPTTPASATRSTAPGATPSRPSPSSGRPATRCRTRSTPRRSTRSGARSARELADLHRTLRLRGVPRRRRAAAAAGRPHPAARRGHGGARAAHRLPLRPAAGLVPLRAFYGSLADGTFHSTQYIRHHSVPLYTPEPDVVHEVVGHANCLASDRFAALYRAAGRAARRVEDGDALEFVSKVFWFSLEFGVLREDGQVRTYGAGLLSSYGEIQEIAQADLRPLDLARMGVQTYDITHYQPLLFCAESFDHVEDVVGGFFDSVDDDLVAPADVAGVLGQPLTVGIARVVSRSDSAWRGTTSTGAGVVAGSSARCRRGTPGAAGRPCRSRTRAARRGRSRRRPSPRRSPRPRRSRRSAWWRTAPRPTPRRGTPVRPRAARRAPARSRAAGAAAGRPASRGAAAHRCAGTAGPRRAAPRPTRGCAGTRR